MAASNLVEAGAVKPESLLELLLAAPGGAAGVALLRSRPDAVPMEVGKTIAGAISAAWTETSTHSVGGHFRAWCKAAGLEIRVPPRRAKGGR
jgi:hypothetical protein